MAERSSELDQINDFGPGDRTRADNVRTMSGEVGALSDDASDEVRDLTSTRRTETSIATTGGATTVDATADDAATNVSPSDAVVDAAAEPEEIRASIEHTRTEMSETINAIQEKLSISNLAGQVKEEVTEQISGAYETAKHALFGATVGKAGSFMEKVSKTMNQFSEDYGPALSEAGTTVVRTAKTNPVPFALIGMGLGLLLLGGSSKKTRKVKSYRYSENDDYDLDRGYQAPERKSYKSYTQSAPNRTNQQSTTSKAYNAVGGAASSAYEGVSSAASSAYSGVSSATGSALSSVSSVAGSAYDKVGNLGSGAKQAARWTQETYERQLDENPFAVGGVAFALGTVIGLALPSTEAEGQLLGEARENLLQQAQEAAGGLIDKVQQVAGEVTQAVREEAKTQGVTA